MSYVTKSEFDLTKNILLTQDMTNRELIAENERLSKSLTTTNRNLFQKMDQQHRNELHSIFNDAQQHRDSNSAKIQTIQTTQLNKKDIEQTMIDYYGDDIKQLWNKSHTHGAGGDWFDEFKKWLESFGLGLGLGGVAVAGLAIYFLFLRKTRGK